MFKLGILLTLALVIWMTRFGGTDTDTTFRILIVVAGWLLFAPVRRAMFGRKEKPE